MGIMSALPAGKDFDETCAVGGRDDAYLRQSETLNHPSVGDQVRTDAFDAKNGFAPAQGGRQDQLIGEMLFRSRALSIVTHERRTGFLRD